jgi:hypothetical protein
MNNAARVISLFVFLFFVFLNPCSALDDPGGPGDVDDFSDETMNQRFDWVITADTTTMKNFLNYPGSGLHPLSKVKVTYRLTSRFGRQRASFDPVWYEDLWYHDCKPVGCRKVHTLDVESGQQGVIHFRQSKDIAQNHCAVANATVRLLLDTGLKSAMLSIVIVPGEIFDQVKSDLGQFNFFPYQIQPDTGISATMHIDLQSEPRGREASLYYFTN